jgi:hypothetical protein
MTATKLTAADEAVLRDFRKRRYAEARAEVRRMRVLLQQHREKLERLADLTRSQKLP